MYLWLTVGLTPLLEPGYFEKIDEFLPYRGRDSSREGVETFSLNELSLGRGVFHRVCFKELSQKQVNIRSHFALISIFIIFLQCLQITLNIKKHTMAVVQLAGVCTIA